MILAVVLWLVGSIAIGFYGHTLGRSPVAFFFGSLFLSPLFVGLFGMATGSDLKRCPHCAEKVHKDASKCKHCGSAIGG